MSCADDPGEAVRTALNPIELKPRLLWSVANQSQTKRASFNKSFGIFLALLGFRDNEFGEQLAHRGDLASC